MAEVVEPPSRNHPPDQRTPPPDTRIHPPDQRTPPADPRGPQRPTTIEREGD